MDRSRGPPRQGIASLYLKSAAVRSATDVRFGSKADIATHPSDVRFVPGPEVEVIALRSNQPMNSSCFWVPPLLGQSGPPAVCIQYQPDRRNPVSPFAVIADR